MFVRDKCDKHGYTSFGEKVTKRIQILNSVKLIIFNNEIEYNVGCKPTVTHTWTNLRARGRLLTEIRFDMALLYYIVM